MNWRTKYAAGEPDPTWNRYRHLEQNIFSETNTGDFEKIFPKTPISFKDFYNNYIDNLSKFAKWKQTFTMNNTNKPTSVYFDLDVYYKIKCEGYSMIGRIQCARNETNNKSITFAFIYISNPEDNGNNRAITMLTNIASHGPGRTIGAITNKVLLNGTHVDGTLAYIKTKSTPFLSDEEKKQYDADVDEYKNTADNKRIDLVERCIRDHFSSTNTLSQFIDNASVDLPASSVDLHASSVDLPPADKKRADLNKFIELIRTKPYIDLTEEVIKAMIKDSNARVNPIAPAKKVRVRHISLKYSKKNDEESDFWNNATIEVIQESIQNTPGLNKDPISRDSCDYPNGLFDNYKQNNVSDYTAERRFYFHLGGRKSRKNKRRTSKKARRSKRSRR